MFKALTEAINDVSPNGGKRNFSIINARKIITVKYQKMIYAIFSMQKGMFTEKVFSLKPH